MDEAFRQATGTKNRVIAFFTTPESTAGQDVEKNVFGDPAVYSQFPEAVFARIDVSKNPEPMGTYAFYRVPILIIFSSDKTELKRLQGSFTKEELTSAYSSVK